MSMNDDNDDLTCGVCGSNLERESCWSCHGEGGYHDCGEDCCPCLDKDEITADRLECGGDGHYFVCPNEKNHPAPETPPSGGPQP